MSWQNEYLAGLKLRDESQRANYELVNAYSKLANHLAVLEANTTIVNRPSLLSAAQNASAPATDDTFAPILLELAEAVRAKGQLQTRLKAAEKTRDELAIKTKADTVLIRSLQVGKAALATKVRDRDEELRGKTQLLVEVQDEVMSLNLQLNVAEQQSAMLKKENKELVDRWVARMNKEVDAMNNALERT